MDDPAKLDELLEHSIIAALFRGSFNAQPENLRHILESLAPLKLSPDTPVAIAAVLGPQFSGKSFLTNFLIQWVSKDGDGGWFNEIVSRTKEGKPMMNRGLAWDSVSSKSFFQGSKTVGGIYMWPQPLVITKAGADNPILVWILHMNIHGMQDEVLEPSEKFLALACSMILEIKHDNDEIRLLEIYRQNTETSQNSRDPVVDEEFCKSASFVIRSNEKCVTGTLTDEEAKEKLLETVKNPERKEAYKKILAKFQHVNVVWMENSFKVLHDQDGVLNATAMKPLVPAIKRLVSQTLDDQEIVRKSILSGGLTLGGMEKFFKTVADKASIWQEENTRYDYSVSRMQQQEACSGVTDLSKEFTQKLSLLESTQNGNMQTPPTYGCNIPATQNNKTAYWEKKVNFVSECEVHVSKTLYTRRVSTSTRTDNETSHDSTASQIGIRYASPAHMQNQSTSPPVSSHDSSLPLLDTPIDMDIDEETGFVIVSTPTALELSKLSRKEAEEMDVDKSPEDFTEPHCNQELPMETESGIEDQLNLTTKLHIASQTDKIKLAAELAEQDAKALRAEEAEMVEQTRLAAVRAEQDAKKANEVPKKTKETGLEAEAKAKLRNTAEKDTQSQRAEMKKVEKAAEKEEQEKLRREKEENRRNEEQKARKMMEDNFLPTAISQIKRAFPVSLEIWFKDNFVKTRIAEIGTIYAHVFKGVKEEYLPQIPDSKLYKEFVAKLDQHCKPEYMKVLDTISNQVQSFNQGLKKLFDFHGYFPPEKLAHLVQVEFEKATKNNDNNELVHKMIILAGDKVVAFYTEHNTIIAGCEHGFRNLAADQLSPIYHNQMKRYLKDAPYGPEKLQRIHWKLVENLAEAFRKACTLQNAVNENIEADAVSFKEKLSPLFLEYKLQNDKIMRAMRDEINKIQNKMKDNYNKEVEAILSKNPDGVKDWELNKLHDSIQSELVKLMEMEIRHKVRKDEPLEQHKQTFLSYIKNYWPEIVKENSKNLKKKLERDEMERKKKDDDERRRREEERQSRINHVGTSDRVLRSTSKAQVYNDPNGSAPPLVFHLQSLRIVMAVIAEDGSQCQILKNESGEDQTHGMIVVTHDGKFIYGSEALAMQQSDPSSQQDGFLWSIANFFLTKNLTWAKDFLINGKNCRITTEFLLGFLLEKLKRKAESHVKARFTRAVIAIPFWLSSTQRIMVKDAAKVAGFKEVFLVNEAAAAAFNFAGGKGEILVISENLDRVDAFVYTNSKVNKKLKMIAHASNYGADEKEQKHGFFRTLKNNAISAWHNFSSYMSSQEPKLSDQELSSQHVRCAYKSALKKAEKDAREIHLNYGLCICENQTKWRSVLENVTRDYVTELRLMNNSVLVGAVKLSKTPNDIGGLVCDKLAYEVSRARVGTASMVMNKKDPLPDHQRTHVISLETGARFASFFQEVLGNSHQIGDVRVDGFDYGQTAEIGLQVSSEAIVDLSIVKKKSFTNATSTRVADEDIQWITPNLTEKKVQDLADILLDLLGPPVPLEDPVLIQTKFDLAKRCQAMIQKVSDGHYRLKSKLAKDSVSNDILKVKAIAEDPTNNSKDVILVQIDFLDKLEERYKKTV